MDPRTFQNTHFDNTRQTKQVNKKLFRPLAIQQKCELDLLDPVFRQFPWFKPD